MVKVTLKLLVLLGKNNLENFKIFKEKYNLISADNLLIKLLKKLSSNDICLTFDDTLKCQYDIAYPILKKEKLNAFYFIYSSVFDKN